MGDITYELKNNKNFLNDDYGLSTIHHLTYGEEMQKLGNESIDSW